MECSFCTKSAQGYRFVHHEGLIGSKCTYMCEDHLLEYDDRNGLFEDLDAENRDAFINNINEYEPTAAFE